jgi:hypothetical protein
MSDRASSVLLNGGLVLGDFRGELPVVVCDRIGGIRGVVSDEITGRPRATERRTTIASRICVVKIFAVGAARFAARNWFRRSCILIFGTSMSTPVRMELNIIPWTCAGGPIEALRKLPERAWNFWSLSTSSVKPMRLNASGLDGT